MTKYQAPNTKQIQNSNSISLELGALSLELQRETKGFTLVEALVALTLLTVGLIPAFIQASSAVTLSSSVRNSLIAAHLAQEGVEVVRAARDGNWFAGQPFNTGLTSCTSGCRVQYDSALTQPLGGNPALKLDPLSGLYQYSSGTDTLFHRTITITAPTSHELAVFSAVTWRERSGDKTFTVEYHLFDWIQ